jgi:archaetidylinositol phosphate synthase
MPATSRSASAPGARSPEAERVHTSLLAAAERRGLIWMAERLPRAISSDHLTILALASLFLAGAGFALAPVTLNALALVEVGLALNWCGDSLDGTLARVRRQTRPRYGFYVDHVVDALGTSALIGGMAMSGLMSPVVALALLAAYFMLCVEVFLAAQTIGTFTMSYFRVGPTELRILLAIGTAAIYWHPSATVGPTIRLFDFGGAIGAIGLVGTFCSSAIAHTRALYRAEPLPRASRIA